MAFPPGVTTVTVKGEYLDANGKPRKGLVQFRPATTLEVGGVAVIGAMVRARLDREGKFAVSLATHEDFDAAGGFPYNIEELFDGGTYDAYSIKVPTSPDTLDLNTATKYARTFLTPYATKAELQELESRLSYYHVVYEPSTEWLVTHNLGYKPSVKVIDSTGEVVIPDIEYVDDNTVRITFANPTFGEAHFS